MSRSPLEDLQFKESSVHRLGSKRCGRVFKGTFKSEPVAVKTFPLKRDVHQDEQHWKKLVHLTHDHLVQYRQFSLQENAWYLVMELCQGSMVDYCRQTLDQSVASHVKGIDIMWQIAHGIDYLHRQEICPGDLKLENVLFRKRNPESRLVFVKLTGYGYSNNHFQDDAKFYLSPLGRLFYSAATKEEAEPKGPISLDSLTEIDVDHRDLALNLISLLVSESFSDGIEAGTVLRHPLFTRCTNEGRSRLKEDLKNEKEWNSEQAIQDWRDSLDESDFSGEVFDDFKEILLENKDIASLVDKAFKTTPKMVSEYIWHFPIASRSGLKGNYQTKLIEKQEVLGTGTYGKVYKCVYTDRKGNRFPAAMKKCKHNRNAEMEEEIKTLRQLSHLFVVKYIDVVKVNSKKFIVMELCEGSLMDYVEGKLQRIPKDSLDDKIIISQIALGLAYIHDKGIIHKDLNLKNILLKFQSERLVLAKIAYFGFAKELKPGTDEFSKTKRPGTENYMAPELLKAPDDAYPATFASDVYALGITIAQLVGKGKHPFSSNSITRRFSMISGLTPPNLKGPWDLIDLILKLTEKDPAKRPEMALVLRHPYFVLTNDKTKRHFVDQLWTGLKLLPKKERQNVVKEIFNNKNFQEWYHKLCDSKPDTVEKMETMAKTLQGFYSDIWEKSLSAAKEYDEAIKGAITSDYDENVGSRINQMNSFQGLFRGISRYRLYNLVERAPQLLVPYFWLHLLDVSGKAISFRNPTSPRKRRFSSESIGHSTISELEWSSLYFNDEEDIDELWNIKYSENYENFPESIQEIIRTVAKCNVSERVWSALLRNMETTKAAEILYEVVQSNTRNAAKVTEMILQRCDASHKEKLSHVHILVASNEGECAAGIMRVLLNHGVHPKNAVSKVGMTPVHYAAQNESSSGPELMQLLLEKGGDPNTCSITLEKSTPVHWAASNQGEYAAEILKLLLDRGGKCDALVGSLEPIHLATMNNGESAPELLDLLLRKRGSNVVHENTGMSLVHFTMFNNGDGGPKIAKKLLENRAEPNARDRRKQTPLHLAAKDTTGEDSQIPIMAELLKMAAIQMPWTNWVERQSITQPPTKENPRMKN